MSLAAGALSQVAVTDTTAQLSSAAATGGTGPYTYQWYRAQTSGFSPGGGNIISGATSLSLTDSGLVPNTQYYYKVVATDTGNSNVTANSSALSVVTAAQTLSQNQFALSPLIGMIDMRFPYDTISVQIDSSQATALYPGAAVKMVDSAGGVPKVVGIAALTDQVLGFINFDIKTVQFVAGSPAEISMSGNVMYLVATAAIARGAQVIPSILTMGGVSPLVGSGAANIVGWALDKASASGDVIRVFIKSPSFLADGT